MKNRLGDRIRLQHILDAIAEIEMYLDGVTYESYVANSEKRFATVKQIEIIGEACNALTDKLKAEHPEVPWSPIRGFRNISVHEYFGVNFHLVWEIAKYDLPNLEEQIKSIVSSLD